MDHKLWKHNCLFSNLLIISFLALSLFSRPRPTPRLGTLNNPRLHRQIDDDSVFDDPMHEPSTSRRSSIYQPPRGNPHQSSPNHSNSAHNLSSNNNSPQLHIHNAFNAGNSPQLPIHNAGNSGFLPWVLLLWVNRSDLYKYFLIQGNWTQFKCWWKSCKRRICSTNKSRPKKM